jgi:hypothetical protein
VSAVIPSAPPQATAASVSVPALPCTPADALSAAADWLDWNVWVQGCMQGPGEACALTALGIVIRIPPPDSPRYTWAVRLLQASSAALLAHIRATDPTVTSVWAWNDADRQTKGDVVRALRAAAAEARR